MSNVTDGADLLFQLLGGSENIGKLLDLSRLPMKMLEIEHKYRLPTDRQADGGLLVFVTRLAPYLKARNATVRHSSPFVGIDQYYLVESHEGMKVTFRYRLGANKPAELTAKFAIGENGNVVRGEISLDVSNNRSPESIRGILTLITKLAKHSTQFAIRQDGIVMRVHDLEFGELEIVNYQVVGISPVKPSIAFVEIESKARDIESALRAIRAYEDGLGFTDLRCEESISELFAPT